MTTPSSPARTIAGDSWQSSWPWAWGSLPWPCRRSRHWRHSSIPGGKRTRRASGSASLPWPPCRDGPPQRCPVIADRSDAWNRYPDEAIGAIFLCRAEEQRGSRLAIDLPAQRRLRLLRSGEEEFLLPFARRIVRSARPPTRSEEHQPAGPRFVGGRNPRRHGGLGEVQKFQDGTSQKSSRRERSLHHAILAPLVRSTHRPLNLPGQLVPAAHCRRPGVEVRRPTTIAFTLVVQAITGLVLWMYYSAGRKARGRASTTCNIK